jgi:chromatin remodeling complex protein RSC6
MNFLIEYYNQIKPKGGNMAHHKKRKANPAFLKAIRKELKCSPELREFIGEKKISRTELTKKIWKHIKKKKLQVEGNGRVVRVDSKLAPLISKRLVAKKRKIEMRGKEIKIPAGHVFMTELTQIASKHLEG